MYDAGLSAVPFANDAHHIVAGNAEGAEEARTILTKFGINANDPANGVLLPNIANDTNKYRFGQYHGNLHTAAYYQQVNEDLRGASSTEDCIIRLRIIAQKLQAGIYPR
jgi:hypothetical protein